MTKTTNHTKEGFVMVLNGIFELGLSTDALAIYCYMASKSPTWDYRPTEIKKTLQIGQSIWLRATGELKALGLYEVKPSKDGSQIVLNRFRGADIRKPDVGKP
ncbi:MAG: hypothetical protein KAG66_11605, partial [Methylococcales bacterium]|nr:hypothetical protein [Methylococcales bacterium]